LGFYNFPAYFYVILTNIGQYFYVVKNTKSDIKMLGFRQNFQNTKKYCKKKKMILCIRLSVSKLKNHIVLFIHQKNNVLAFILALITSLLKSREHWLKFYKKKLFCLSFSIRGTTLHVIHILDIKFFFWMLELLDFTPLR